MRATLLALTLASIAALGLPAAWRAPGTAAPAPPGTLDVRLGFEGALRVGVTVPVTVRIPPGGESGPATVVIETFSLSPQIGVTTTSTIVPLNLTAGVTHTVEVPVVVEDIRRPPVVRLVRAGRDVRRAVVPIDPQKVGGRVVVALSDTPAGLEAVPRTTGRVVTAYVTAEALPRRWMEYGAVDLLVVRDLDQDRLDPAQRSALVTWVRLGGHLLVVARPDRAPPEFLTPLLPAQAGGPRSVASLGGLVPGAGPSGPATVVALVARPGAAVARAGDAVAAASAPAGAGRVTIWGVDPWTEPLAAWDGLGRLWAAALPPVPAPLLDSSGIARHLPISAPMDGRIQAGLGLVMSAYLAALIMLRRRAPHPAGALWRLVVAACALVIFAAGAGEVRSRSAVLTQVTVVEPAPGESVGRATVIAAAGVPYGGPVAVRAPRGAAAGAPAPAGDLAIEWDAGGEVPSGVRPDDAAGPVLRGLHPSARAWTFQAVTTTPVQGWASLGADARRLTVDLGTGPLRRAGVWWRGRAYLLGDLPRGRTVHVLAPDRWRRASEFDAAADAPLWIFRRPDSDAIIEVAAPVLVGELATPAPAFTLVGKGAPGTRFAVLLVPLGREAAGGTP